MKISRNLMISRRIRKLRRKVDINTQKMRAEMLDSLEEIFRMASSLARGEFGTQTEEGETVKVTLKQRQVWARVAAFVAQTMNSIAEGFDERQIDTQMDELERLIDEAKAKGKARRTQEKGAKATRSRDTKGQK